MPETDDPAEPARASSSHPPTVSAWTLAAAAGPFLAWGLGMVVLAALRGASATPNSAAWLFAFKDASVAAFLFAMAVAVAGVIVLEARARPRD